MKYAKKLALAAVAAGALMAFIGAGTASATVFCSTTTTGCSLGQKIGNISITWSNTLSIKWVQTNGESVDTCTTSAMKGKITNSGSSTETVSGPVESWTWESCTFPTKTLAVGSLEVHKIAGTSNGTVTAGGTFEVTINTILFGSCVFKIEKGVDFGDLAEGNPATLKLNMVASKVVGGAACPGSLQITGSEGLTISGGGTTVSVSDS